MATIYDFINKCGCDTNLANEIDNVFNNIDSNNCSVKDDLVESVTINGISSVFSDTGLYNLTYIIPNIFRKCFYSNQIKLPQACPSYTSSSKGSRYLPLILNENTIKSFLYFNFPGSSKNYNSNRQLTTMIKLKDILNKKKNATYSSYTPAIDIVNEIYTQDSILFQLITLNNYLLKCSDYSGTSTTGNVFYIKWDMLISCLSYNDNDNIIYTIGNNATNSNNTIEKLNYINNQQGYLFNKLRYTNVMGDSDLDVPINLLSNILNYAEQVYEDITLGIQYFMTSGVFCKKDYMSPKIFPVLLKFYKIYYKNQQYIFNKSLNLNNVSYVNPTTITIIEYINKFISIFTITYPNTTYLKNVILSNENGLVFFNNNLIENEYYYYYIDIFNPSPVNLSNSWILTIDYSTSGIDIFINNFLYGVGSYPGFLDTSGTTTFKFKSYVGGGLYPDKGLDYSSLNNIGYKYLFYNSNEKLLYTVYLTLQTINTVEAYGVSLII